MFANYYAVALGILWGYKLGELANTGSNDELLHEMQSTDDAEGLLTSWAEEFVSSGTNDIEDFFEQKLEEFFDNENE